MGKFIRTLTTLHESLNGTMEKGSYKPGYVQRIGMGHIVFHQCDERVDRLVGVGKKRMRDGTLVDGANMLVQVVDAAAVIRYVEEAMAGYSPTQAEIDKGMSERRAIPLDLLDPAVVKLYEAHKSGKAKVEVPAETVATSADDGAISGDKIARAKRGGK